METKVLPSGAVLEITMAEFEVGNILLKAVSREIEGIRLSGNLQDNSFKLELLKNLTVRAIYSESIGSALKLCFERCTYNKSKINSEVFESEKSRGDYLVVVKEVLEYNLKPFFGHLVSLFKDIISQTEQGLEPKSP